MIDYLQLKGKTIAVTGASSGIGKETVKLLSELGVNVVIGSRSIDQLNELKSSFEKVDASILPISLDVKDEISVQQFVQKAIDVYGRIDVLINCAGVGSFTEVLDLSVEDFDEMIAVNLRGTFLCCKYFGKHMVENQNGHIINISSIAGTIGLPGCGGYSASKFGVNGLSKVLQAEVRQKGVQVTTVMPGSVSSPFWEKMETTPDLSLMIPPESLAKHIIFLLCQPKGSIVDEVTVMPPLGIL